MGPSADSREANVRPEGNRPRWPAAARTLEENRKNARPKTNTRQQRENLFSSTLDRSRGRAEFFTSGGALESRAPEESKTNAPRHFRRRRAFFPRTHYRGEKLRTLMGGKWPTFENRN